MDKVRENRLRRLARRQGLVLRKSRAGIGLDNFGKYRIVDFYRNWLVAGEKFDLSLDDVEAYLGGL
jgi:hypothetical protein